MFLALSHSKGCADLGSDADVVELLAVPCYEDHQPHTIFAMDPDIPVSVRAVALVNLRSLPPKRVHVA
jgi:hypothetical protein